MAARPSRADRIYLAIEKLLDEYRRDGTNELEIAGVLERAWRASRAIHLASLEMSTRQRR